MITISWGSGPTSLIRALSCCDGLSPEPESPAAFKRKISDTFWARLNIIQPKHFMNHIGLTNRIFSLLFIRNKLKFKTSNLTSCGPFQTVHLFTSICCYSCCRKIHVQQPDISGTTFGANKYVMVFGGMEVFGGMWAFGGNQVGIGSKAPWVDGSEADVVASWPWIDGIHQAYPFFFSVST
jgi:hypothetical protein